jgi:ankyrin repeat protein
LRADPSLAKVTARDGTTPLWWLPDDETRAIQIVELLLAHGADPASPNPTGKTAADWARERGMLDVAARLDGTNSAST